MRLRKILSMARKWLIQRMKLDINVMDDKNHNQQLNKTKEAYYDFIIKENAEK